jgi:hypothetical protein
LWNLKGKHRFPLPHWAREKMKTTFCTNKWSNFGMWVQEWFYKQAGMYGNNFDIWEVEIHRKFFNLNGKCQIRFGLYVHAFQQYFLQNQICKMTSPLFSLSILVFSERKVCIWFSPKGSCARSLVPRGMMLRGDNHMKGMPPLEGINVVLSGPCSSCSSWRSNLS